MDDFHWTIAFGGRDDWNAVLWMRWKMRLTDVDKLIEIAHRIRLDSRERIEQMIESAPTVDPVKHGYWELSPFDGNWACSNCGNKPYHDNMKNMNYCPNCGAKMGEDRDYEHAVEQLEHDMTFEPTYNPEDGSM